MTKFKDCAGREWTVAVTVDAVKRVRADCDGLDLLAVADGQLFTRLLADPVLLVDVLFSVCGPAAREAGVSADQFGAAMAGQAIDDGTTALLEALTGFFRSGQRATYRAALAKLRQAEDLATATATAGVEAIDVAGLMTAAPGRPSTASPGSAGWTPAP